MKKERFDIPSLGKEDFRVPEGYFTSLKELRDANDEQSRIENAAKM